MVLLSVFSSANLFGQCSSGEVEIELFIETDQYGYEGYWSLTYGQTGCGINEIANGGNSAVGCNGGGIKAQPSGGYGNNQTFSAGTWCVKMDTMLTLYAVDDWGDGGFGYTLKVNGYEVLAIDATGSNDSWTVYASEPPAIDAELSKITTPFMYTFAGISDVKGVIHNRGKDTITSFDISYSVNNGAVHSASFSGTAISYGDHAEFTHSTPVNLSSGNHVIKVWSHNINGQVDSANFNDTLLFNFEVGPGIPNIIDQYLGVTPIEIEIGNSSHQLNKPTDLDFHPVLSRKELWVINKRTEQQGGSTVTYHNAGETNQTNVHKVDGNAWHFMSLPTGIAFGENGNFANSPGVFDANHNGGTPFTGPALWSSDPLIYAQPSGGNGSHLDMLHFSPKCQGIAHEVDNVYWVFDGQSSDIVRYDFAEDHGPGASYHGDAIVHRYRDHSVAKDPQEKVVSHLVLDKSTNWLYVVDHGNKRVMRLDIKSGTKGSNSNIYNYEPVKEYKNVVGYTWETVVDTGLQEPAGIDLVGNRMIVSDYATGEIIIYDISAMPATELGRIVTGAIGIMGVKIGPEGKIWYVDFDANKVFKVDGAGIGLNEGSFGFSSLYPNPSNGSFKVNFNDKRHVRCTITDLSGKLVWKDEINSDKLSLDLELSPGSYLLTVRDLNNGNVLTEKLIIQ